MRRTAPIGAFVIAALAACFGACADENGLVGGLCASGYVESGGECVPAGDDAGIDAAESGAADATQLTDGGIDALPDVLPSDAPSDAPGDALPDSPSDAPSDTSSDAPPEAGTDGGTESGADGGTESGADGGTDGGADTGADASPIDAASDACVSPFAVCGGSCVDLATDPQNCGKCGNFCPTNLCSAGTCQGSAPGDVVYIGHDYLNAAVGSAQARVLANAVFIPSSNPVRVLSYERYADTTALKRVKTILNTAAGQRGRTLGLTSTTNDADIPSTLTVSTYDVLLVPDQVNAPAGALAALGTSWNAALTTFTRAGGTVVVLDGGGSATDDMPGLATDSGIIAVTGHTSLAAGSPVTVVAPTDIVGVGVLSPYGVTARSVTLSISPDPNVVVVVREANSPNAPVVLHRFVN